MFELLIERDIKQSYINMTNFYWKSLYVVKKKRLILNMALFNSSISAEFARGVRERSNEMDVREILRYSLIKCTIERRCRDTTKFHVAVAITQISDTRNPRRSSA